MGGTGRGLSPSWSLLSVGMVLVTCLFLGYFLGHYLDGKLGTGPWLAAGGFLLGAAAGFLELFRTAARHMK